MNLYLWNMFGVNSNFFIPIVITIVLFIAVKVKNGKLINNDPRDKDLLSHRANVARQLNWIQSQSAVNKLGLEESTIMFEFALIQYKLDQNDGDFVKTAREMGISLESLNSKLGGLGLISSDNR